MSAVGVTVHCTAVAVINMLIALAVLPRLI
jgi:hypothetical protein